MKSLLLSFVVVFHVLLAAPVLADAQERHTLVVLGDSLSAAYGMAEREGWVALLERRLADEDLPWRVVNASISGDTTRGGLTRLPRVLERHRPSLVIIELGGNDGLRGVHPNIMIDEMRENLAELVRLSREAGAEVLLLGMHLPPNYGNHFTERFHAVYHEVARAHGVPLVPFFLEGVAEDRALMQPDGIHPTAEAQPRMLENVWEALKPMLEPVAGRQ
ncbi:arylesterase [Thioalkalivibrio sulfidiphilus]|uniref:arylesterase n=1 Tax=Thioalkalivibrio sulfidiphilus TaxID=1033854 RepID=UPI000382E7CF|nr:arylesterase [Thioalkalivibrio sulfidiphilus]